MARRAVLFDLGGVLVTPSLRDFLGSYEQEFGLPRNFLRDLLLSGGSHGPFSRALRGNIPLSQLCAEVDEGCRQEASSAGISLPDGFSVGRAFQALAEQERVRIPLLRAAETLRRNGFQTCVLAHQWVDDGAGRLLRARLLARLRRHFHLVLESCRVGISKPDPRLFSHALQALQAQPHQAILLEEFGENLELARDMGMATILVGDKDVDTVLGELEELSGVQLRSREEPIPLACDPSGVTHGYVQIRPGVQLHFAELGQGPALCLFHGFPECWLSWRFQIPALADAGFRVIALDMKGYGESTAPPDIQEYSLERICQDLTVFLDKLGIPQAVLVGHDWGGAVSWFMSLFHPERVRAVASLNTPFRPADPSVDILERMRSHPALEYQFYFQEPGVAEQELERDIGRSLRILIRSTRREDRLPQGLKFQGILERGGLLVGCPEDPPPSLILQGPELEYYIQQFQRSGFRGPLNWYRNIRANWHWALSARHRKIRVPALLVTAGQDVVLHPGLSKGMEQWIPRLRREHLELCGHWTQLERPAEVNRILLEWLQELPPDPPFPGNSKL